MKLSHNAFNKIKDYLLNEARPLEWVLFNYNFLNGDVLHVVKELKKFQNEDGGFHGLEPDAVTPKSSPFQTSYAFQYLIKFDTLDEVKEMIKKAIIYLESTYQPSKKRWYTYSKDVNESFHTPWWHFNEDNQMTPIDSSYGNPTAEICGYLLRYKEYVNKINVDQLLEEVIAYFEKKEQFKSEHEVYCFIRLYHECDDHHQYRLNPIIRKAINQLINLDETIWEKQYVPTPLDFIENPKDNEFGINDASIMKNLDFIINKLEKKSMILPPWGDVFYEGEFKASYKAWMGILTLNSLVLLKNFNKI